MIDIPKIAAGLLPKEREWILGWQGARGVAFNSVAGDLLRKGLVRTRLNWTLTETGYAVRDYLRETA